MNPCLLTLPTVDALYPSRFVKMSNSFHDDEWPTPDSVSRALHVNWITQDEAAIHPPLKNRSFILKILSYSPILQDPP